MITDPNVAMAVELNRSLALTSIDKRVVRLCENLGIHTVGQLRNNFFQVITSRGGNRRVIIQSIAKYFRAIGIDSIPMPSKYYNNLTNATHGVLQK